jgi:hypothetical protein
MSEADRGGERGIQLRAYLMWEMEGRPDGRADEYWHRARERIEAETQSAYPPVQSRGAPNLMPRDGLGRPGCASR